MSSGRLLGFLFNLLTLLNTFITLLTCFIIFSILIIACFYKKKNTHFLLYLNTYLSIFAYSSVSSSFYLDIFLDDIRKKSLTKNVRFCRIRGSIISVFLSSIIGTFCLQALFRLFRLVFKEQKFLTKYPVQIVLILLQWLISFLFVSFIPIVHLPNEYYCYSPFHPLKSSILSTIVAIVLPLTIIPLSYIRSKHLSCRIQRRTRHDFLIIRRLLIIVCILCIFDIPSTILFFYEQIKGNRIHVLIHRIEWLIRSFLWMILSFYLVRFDSSLRKIFFRKLRSKNDYRENSSEQKTTSIILFI